MGSWNAQVGQMCSFASWYDLQTVPRGESESKSRAILEPICFPCKIVYWRVNHAREIMHGQDSQHIPTSFTSTEE